MQYFPLSVALPVLTSAYSSSCQGADLSRGPLTAELEWLPWELFSFMIVGWHISNLMASLKAEVSSLADLSPRVLPYSCYFVPIHFSSSHLLEVRHWEGNWITLLFCTGTCAPFGGIRFLQTRGRKRSVLAALTRTGSLKGLYQGRWIIPGRRRNVLLSTPSKEVKGPNKLRSSSGLNLEVWV